MRVPRQKDRLIWLHERNRFYTVKNPATKLLIQGHAVRT
jgi:hypothetical protein